MLSWATRVPTRLRPSVVMMHTFSAPASGSRPPGYLGRRGTRGALGRRTVDVAVQRRHGGEGAGALPVGPSRRRWTRRRQEHRGQGLGQMLWGRISVIKCLYWSLWCLARTRYIQSGKESVQYSCMGQLETISKKLVESLLCYCWTAGTMPLLAEPTATFESRCGGLRSWHWKFRPPFVRPVRSCLMTPARFR